MRLKECHLPEVFLLNFSQQKIMLPWGEFFKTPVDANWHVGMSLRLRGA
jgi:hypothetical protein